MIKTVPTQELCHPEIFYSDIFSAAFQMVSMRKSKDWESNRKTLLNNPRKFFALAMKTNEEKSIDTKKYVGQVDLESNIVY